MWGSRHPQSLKGDTTLPNKVQCRVYCRVSKESHTGAPHWSPTLVNRSGTHPWSPQSNRTLETHSKSPHGPHTRGFTLLVGEPAVEAPTGIPQSSAVEPTAKHSASVECAIERTVESTEQHTVQHTILGIHNGAPPWGSTVGPCSGEFCRVHKGVYSKTRSAHWSPTVESRNTESHWDLTLDPRSIELCAGAPHWSQQPHISPEWSPQRELTVESNVHSNAKTQAERTV